MEDITARMIGNENTSNRPTVANEGPHDRSSAPTFYSDHLRYSDLPAKTARKVGSRTIENYLVLSFESS